MFYDKNSISNYVSELNKLLLDNNVANLYADSSYNIFSNNIDLNFSNEAGYYTNKEDRYLW